MLRATLICLGFLLALGAWLLFRDGGSVVGVIAMLVNAAALTGGIMFERIHYKPTLDRPPGPEWIDTGERFVDPRTGRIVTVFSQPTTGERAYVGGLRRRVAPSGAPASFDQAQ